MILRRCARRLLPRSGSVSSCSSSSVRLSHSQPLSHVTEDGRAPRMVDVGDKRVSRRVARAEATVVLPREVAAVLEEGGPDGGLRVPGRDIHGPKGAVFSTSIIAGVMAAKRTSDLIPFCHQLNLNKCDVALDFCRESATITVSSEVSVEGKTGVEMEALTSVSVAALCVYDMLKAMSHDIRITDVHLVSKTGGKSDVHCRPPPPKREKT